MAVLKKSALERYLRDRFGPSTEVLAYGPIGKETSGAQYKQYGYGAPVRLTFRVEGQVRQAVLGTMSPGPFGHEHPADRAQAMLWDYACYSRLPKHIAALDVGAFTARNDLMSVAAAKEFFLLTQWSEGETYNKDLERLAQAAKPTAMDRKRVTALADYLATIHRVKHRDPQLYRRRLRELLGHGECIMGLTDSYPDRFAFISQELLESIETPATAGAGDCGRNMRVSRKCTVTSIPGTCSFGAAPISRCSTVRVANGVNQPTTSPRCRSTICFSRSAAMAR